LNSTLRTKKKETMIAYTIQPVRFGGSGAVRTGGNSFIPTKVPQPRRCSKRKLIGGRICTLPLSERRCGEPRLVQLGSGRDADGSRRPVAPGRALLPSLGNGMVAVSSCAHQRGLKCCATIFVAAYRGKRCGQTNRKGGHCEPPFVVLFAYRGFPPAMVGLGRPFSLIVV